MNTGPTGDYPIGKMRPDDKGGLNVGISCSVTRRLIIMEFGTTVTWIGVPAAEALEYAKVFRQKVKEDFGDLPYDASTLPIRVEADIKKGVVISHMPIPTNMLVANPECFLGWAEQMERAAKEILN